MQVTGHIITSGGEPEWVPPAATPVDENGTSLAGNSESQNEGYFAALDQTVFGASRSLLVGDKVPATVTLSPDYQASFVNSDDAELGPGIDKAIATTKGIPYSDIPNGTVVTVTFSDGTKAQYIKIGNFTDHWVWTGKAWNKLGKPINRDGSLKSNSNSAGATGGGSADFTVGSAHFNFEGKQMCTWAQALTIDGSTTYAFFQEPC